MGSIAGRRAFGSVFFSRWSKAVGMWAKARAVGNAPALSTARAGARQRIVHMSTAVPRGAVIFGAQLGFGVAGTKA